MARKQGTAFAETLVAVALLATVPIAAVVLSPASVARSEVAAAAQLPSPGPGMARVWFVRQYEPSESLATPMIYVNGAPLAPSMPGTIFYRDLAPGTYAFTVDTCGQDVNQFQTLHLAPGAQAELEIQSLSSFTPSDCRVRETFYVRPIAPRFLQLYLPQLAYLGPR